MRIVSDANLFFIETILKHLGIIECFSEINTNPGYVDDSGRLGILPYHDFQTLPHSCNNLCPPNMCKVCRIIPKSLIKLILFIHVLMGPKLILLLERFLYFFSSIYYSFMDLCVNKLFMLTLIIYFCFLKKIL